MHMRLPYLLIGLALVLFGAFIRIVDPTPLPQLREAYFDTLQQVSPREAQEFPIEIVAIDEASLAALGQWPWPRGVLAELTNALNDAGAAVVAFDILFAEPDRSSLASLLSQNDISPEISDLIAETGAVLDGDEAFADAIFAMPTVLGTSLTTHGAGQLYEKAGFITIGQPAEGAVWPSMALTPVLPSLEAAAEGVGVINTSPANHGGIIRQVPLAWFDGNSLRPSFSLETLRVALGEGAIFVSSSVDLKNVVEGISVGDFFFPTDSAGAFRMKYTPEDVTSYLPAIDVLGLTIDELAERVAGKIIFVGATAPGLFDIRTTALGETVPGVSVHKQILEQVFAGEFLIRTEFQAGIEIAIFVLLGIVVAIAVSMKNSFVTVAAGAGSAGIILFASYWGYVQQGVLLDITFPLFGGLLNLALMAGYQFVVLDRDKRLLRRSFQHYVAPTVLEEIEKSGQTVGLSGENKEITVMFADVRGFTQFAESRDPKQVVSVLNGLFSRFTAQILERSGTVDKYVGDAVMAFWGAPIETNDHATQGLLTALEFRAALASFNQEMQSTDIPALRMAVGVASGMACVGNIGSDQRFSYTAIGKTVNLAARIEAACREVAYDIVASEDAARASGLAWLPAGRLALKGFSEPVALAVIVGDTELSKRSEFVELRDLLAAMIAGAAKKPDRDQRLSEALILAQQVEPGLSEFVQSMQARRVI